jgi:hypothetical protein
MDIRDHKGRLNRIEKQLFRFQNLNHNSPPFDSLEGPTIWEEPGNKGPLEKEPSDLILFYPIKKSRQILFSRSTLYSLGGRERERYNSA